MSGDMDLVVERLRYDAAQIESVCEALGFERVGRHWRMRDLFVEVPSTTLSDPSEWMRVGNAVFEIIKKEVVLADRIIGYRQWGTLGVISQSRCEYAADDAKSPNPMRLLFGCRFRATTSIFSGTF